MTRLDDTALDAALLGAAMCAADAALAVVRDMRPDDFERPQDRAVFEAMRQLAASDIGIDLVTVYERLRQGGLLGRVGGILALSALAEAVTTTAYTPGHIRLARERRAVRAMTRAAASVTERAAKGVRDVGEFVTASQAAVARAASELDAEDADRSDFAAQVDGFAEAVFDETKQKLPTVRTGLRPLDDMIGGIDREVLTLIAGRPGMGKSSMCLAFAVAALQRGDRVAWFALEERRSDIIRRMIAFTTGVPSNRIKARAWRTDEDLRAVSGALNLMRTFPLTLVCRPRIGSHDVSDECAAVRAAHGQVDLVIVDHTTLLRERGTFASTHARVTQSVQNLAALAKEEHAAVVAAYQLNREVEGREDRRPRLSDLRESGSPEEQARLVLMLFNPGYYDRDSPDPDWSTCHVNIAKNNDGPTGEVAIPFVRECTRFHNAEHRGETWVR